MKRQSTVLSVLLFLSGVPAQSHAFFCGFFSGSISFGGAGHGNARAVRYPHWMSPQLYRPVYSHYPQPILLYPIHQNPVHPGLRPLLPEASTR